MNLAETIAEKRRSADLYFDSGDCVKSGNLSVPLHREEVWGLLEIAGCAASVPGNREFHIAQSGFRAKLEGAAHPVLAANLHWKESPSSSLLPAHHGEFRLQDQQPLASGTLLGEVGVFGVMVPMVTQRMAAKYVSAFFNTSPIEAALRCVEHLRERASVIICLSHIGLKQDVELAEKVAGIDIILGGHSHDVLSEPLRIHDTFICQTGSHGQFLGKYEFENKSLRGELIPLR